jgi:hypothetical protein
MMPYPSEHACRLNEPGKYTSFARKNCEQKHDGKCIDVIYGISEGKSEIQALRYPKGSWDADAARSHCSGRGGSFEAASEKNVTRTVFKTMTATIIDNPSIENKSKSKTNRQRQGAYTAIAMVGDQFWNKGRTKEFCLFNGIKQGYKSMDKTFHNLDHGADPHGSGHLRISDIVGVQDYTEIDEQSKQMIMYIYPDEHMPSYNTWKSFVDMCQKNGKTPNVSIEAMVTQEQMMAKDIPVENLDYKQYGFSDEDMVWVETGYRFIGAATVWMGACDDSDGCGIITPDSDEDVRENDAVVSNCDCNTDVASVKQFILEPEIYAKLILSESKEKKDIMTEEVKKEEKTKEPEGVDLRIQEIETLKTKLTSCGEIRQQIVNENTELTKRILDLEKQNQVLIKEKQELTDKLNTPITRIEEHIKDETVSDRGIKALKSLMKK